VDPDPGFGDPALFYPLDPGSGINYLFDYEYLLLKPSKARKNLFFMFNPSFYVGSEIRDEKFGSGSGMEKCLDPNPACAKL
jgi:hypothetical protein